MFVLLYDSHHHHHTLHLYSAFPDLPNTFGNVIKQHTMTLGANHFRNCSTSSISSKTYKVANILQKRTTQQENKEDKEDKRQEQKKRNTPATLELNDWVVPSSPRPDVHQADHLHHQGNQHKHFFVPSPRITTIELLPKS